MKFLNVALSAMACKIALGDQTPGLELKWTNLNLPYSTKETPSVPEEVVVLTAEVTHDGNLFGNWKDIGKNEDNSSNFQKMNYLLEVQTSSGSGWDLDSRKSVYQKYNANITKEFITVDEKEADLVAIWFEEQKNVELKEPEKIVYQKDLASKKDLWEDLNACSENKDMCRKVDEDATFKKSKTLKINIGLRVKGNTFGVKINKMWNSTNQDITGSFKADSLSYKHTWEHYDPTKVGKVLPFERIETSSSTSTQEDFKSSTSSWSRGFVRPIPVMTGLDELYAPHSGKWDDVQPVKEVVVKGILFSFVGKKHYTLCQELRSDAYATEPKKTHITMETPNKKDTKKTDVQEKSGKQLKYKIWSDLPVDGVSRKTSDAAANWYCLEDAKLNLKERDARKRSMDLGNPTWYKVDKPGDYWAKTQLQTSYAWSQDQHGVSIKDEYYWGSVAFIDAMSWMDSYPEIDEPNNDHRAATMTFKFDVTGDSSFKADDVINTVVFAVPGAKKEKKVRSTGRGFFFYFFGFAVVAGTVGACVYCYNKKTEEE